jgi:twinkle protein
MTDNWVLLEQVGINLHNKKYGSLKTQCPKCSTDRKNKKDPCLSVNVTEGVYNCHHCDFKGKVFEKKQKEYTLPPKRLEKLEKETIEYFEKHRGISNNTLLVFKVSDGVEWMPKAQAEIPVICFNYYKNGNLTNVKYRGKSKDFKMHKDAELIFYNLDALDGSDEAVICEGEIDALSLYEAGIYNVVSVPNGASKGSQKLEYLDNCWQYFEDKKRIVLFTDSDEAGEALKDELARRLGANRCFVVSYPKDCKDSNEVLLKHGKEALRAIYDVARPWPIEGLVTMDDMFETVVSFYENGYPQGTAAKVGEFDNYLTFYPGQLTVITGIPGSGKSEFVDWLMASLAKNHGWSWGVCSFENPPEFHVTKLAEKFTDKSFAFRKDPNHRMTREEFDYSIAKIDEHFYFINLSLVDVTMDGLLEKAEQLVKQKGIKGLLLDPWNCIEHKGDDTNYVLECLNKMIHFLEKYRVHGFLVAHPTKLKKDPKTNKYEIPTLYSISGSAHFFNRTHNGISVWRDFETNTVDVYVQKVKWSWLGKIGFCSYNFDSYTRQYKQI